MTTTVNSGPDPKHRPITTWFRREVELPVLAKDEALVVLVCVDDGAIVYFNGVEIGRMNMPAGTVRGETLAPQTIGNDDEGFYTRIQVPAKLLRAGEKNALAVEVHQASPVSSDLYFDLALKVVPPTAASAKSTAAAQQVNLLFNKQHFLGPEVTIPDGYIDGGRRMKLDANQHASSGREILSIDRQLDKELFCLFPTPTLSRGIFRLKHCGSVVYAHRSRHVARRQQDSHDFF